MPKGSCMCGEVTYEVTGEPTQSAFCHCSACHKTGCSNGSVVSKIKEDDYKHLSGTFKRWTRKGLSGQDVTYHNCATCSTLVYVVAAAMPGMLVLKPGTLDAAADMDAHKPTVELFVRDRVAWCPEFGGAEQKELQ